MTAALTFGTFCMGFGMKVLSPSDSRDGMTGGPMKSALQNAAITFVDNHPQ